MAKYEAKEKDDIRKELVELANEILNAKNESVDSINYNQIDITGSLGCWGIVQK